MITFLQLKKLSETQLPPKEEFYSKLNDEDITDADYQHAINGINLIVNLFVIIMIFS